MSIKYVDEVVYESSYEVAARADFEIQSITFYRRDPRWNLVRTDHFITVFHEFRHLMPANADMITPRDGLLGPDASFEIDARNWASQAFGEVWKR